MKTRGPWETAIICAAIAAAIAIAAPVDNGKWVAVVAVAAVAGLVIALGCQYLAARKRAQVELSGGEQYRRLARHSRPHPFRTLERNGSLKLMKRRARMPWAAAAAVTAALTATVAIPGLGHFAANRDAGRPGRGRGPSDSGAALDGLR